MTPGRPLIEVLFMDDQPKHRGGSHTARKLGLKGIVVHVTPEDYAALKAAATAAGLPLKEFCRRAAMEAVLLRG